MARKNSESIPKFSPRKRPKRARILADLAQVLVLAAGSLMALSQQTRGEDRFPVSESLDSKLIRGKSTRADVLLALGEPQGSGGALVPTDRTPQEIWYYADSTASGLFKLELKQNVLLVFFRGEQYDGYLWFRNRVEGDTKLR